MIAISVHLLLTLSMMLGMPLHKKIKENWIVSSSNRSRYMTMNEGRNTTPICIGNSSILSSLSFKVIKFYSVPHTNFEFDDVGRCQLA
jgi:hypothetical protein